MEQNRLLAKVNELMGKDYTHKSLMETIEDLCAKVEVQQNQIKEYRRKTTYRVYEENLALASELAKLKEVTPV